MPQTNCAVLPKVPVPLTQQLTAKHELRELTDEEAGRLMRAVFIYAVDGMEIDLPPVERMAFLAISGQIARDTRRYEKICEKNRENALMRSQAIAAKEKENEKEKNNSIDKANESDNETPACYAEKTADTGTFEENFVDNPWKSVDNFF